MVDMAVDCPDAATALVVATVLWVAADATDLASSLESGLAIISIS